MRKLYDGFVLIMVALVDTLVGDVVVFEGSIGIAQTNGVVGEKISVDTVGVYEIASTDGDAIAIGDILYYDTVNKVLTISSGEFNVTAGVAWSAKASAEVASVAVKIG